MSKRFSFLQMPVVTVLVAVGILSIALVSLQPSLQAQTHPSTSARGVLLPDFSELVEKEGPAVVNVSIKARASGRSPAGLEDNEQLLEFFRRFMPPEAIPQPRQNPQTPRRAPRTPIAPSTPAPDAPLRDVGQGSGFIISADGYIITNRHVVLIDGGVDPRGQPTQKFADEVTVTLTDEREFKAKVIGADERTDIAVLKIEASGLPKVSIGNSDKLKVGEWVLAIGSPFGFDNTVTAGIVSAKSRETGDLALAPFIQTDAAVNPGNSGGPLFNTKGEVIGVNAQIFTGTGGYLGISFAIPINEAMGVANQLIKNGKVKRSRIGVALDSRPITEDLAEALGLPKKGAGVLVSSIEKDTPAEKAGLKAQDVIQKVDGKAVKSIVEIQRIIFPKVPGTKVTLTIWRGGSVKEITLPVMEAPEDPNVIRPNRVAPQAPKAESMEKPAAKPNRLGLIVEEADEDDKKALSIAGGIIISDVSGAAARAGLLAGDAILALNTTEIKSPAQFNELVATLDNKKPVALLVKRDELPPRYVTLRPDAK
jgi:serine protease Do